MKDINVMGKRLIIVSIVVGLIGGIACASAVPIDSKGSDTEATLQVTNQLDEPLQLYARGCYLAGGERDIRQHSSEIFQLKGACKNLILRKAATKQQLCDVFVTLRGHLSSSTLDCITSGSLAHDDWQITVSHLAP
ncbi:MAG: hypothetical protein CMF50_04885 [Legionellales bacterium]|nr:hypothetical protein [Legionellales bacterium]|tara:strand:- start:21864 stop:22271 length:408 start_codon:yes stop_codon:yes gene_type:complete